MNRLLAFSLCIVLSCSFTLAQAGELMTPDAMSQLGLEQAWARHVHVPAGAQSIRDQQLFVHQKNPHEYVAIVTTQPAAAAAAPDATADAAGGGSTFEPKTLVRIPTNRIGINGAEIGRKEAERLASNEIRRLKRRGIDAEMKIITSPRVNLYTVGSDGMLECRNAESGAPIWIAAVGSPSLPFANLGVDEEYVTVVNGANLIQVDAKNGEIIEEVQTLGAPAFGALNSGHYALIPIIGGSVEGYPLYDPTRLPFKERVSGTTLAMPTKSPDSSKTAWGTSRGFVYVMELQGEPSVQFRLDTDGIVSGRIASASGNRFFFGSETGQVYGIRATRHGQVLWSQPYGEPFYHEPIVYDNQLLLRSSYGNLFSIDVENGRQTWEQSMPNVGNLLGILNGQIYATTLSGGLIVLDLKNGKKVANFNNIRPEHFIVNNLTDRLYLVSNDGDVQCLRVEAADLPTLNSQIEPKSTKSAGNTNTPKAGEQAMQPNGNDPFGASAKQDPFGAGSNKNPFGGGNDGGAAAPADPFGDGGAKGADPFGGGAGGGEMADPFGGSPF